MVVIKGWAQEDRPNFCVSCKGSDKITIHQAWMLIQAAKDGDVTGHIRLTGRSERFEYVRSDDGRIVITQIE